MDQDKKTQKNTTPQSQPPSPAGQSGNEGQQKVVTPQSSQDQPGPGKVVTPQQTGQQQPPAVQTPQSTQKQTGQSMKATTDTSGRGKSGVSTPQTTSSQQPTSSGQQGNQSGQQASSQKASGSSNQANSSSAKQVPEPSGGVISGAPKRPGLGGADESPKTVNSTAASLGNVDPGLSAPPEDSKPLSKVEASEQTQNDSGTSSTSQQNLSAPQQSTGDSTTSTSQDSPQSVTPSLGSVQTQEKKNEMMKQEAGNSGKNN